MLSAARRRLCVKEGERTREGEPQRVTRKMILMEEGKDKKDDEKGEKGQER